MGTMRSKGFLTKKNHLDAHGGLRSPLFLFACLIFNITGMERKTAFFFVLMLDNNENTDYFKTIRCFTLVFLTDKNPSSIQS